MIQVRSNHVAWRVAAVVAVALMRPTPALAHEKWFADARGYPIRLELLWSAPTLLRLV